MPVLMQWWAKMGVQWKGAAADASCSVHSDSLLRVQNCDAAKM